MKKWETILNNQTAISKEELSIINALSYLQVQRLKSGISQTELAKRTGLTQPQIARIESLDTTDFEQIYKRIRFTNQINYI